MGVVNVTPDSFSDGGLHLEAADAIAAGLEMWREGAVIIDVGGESTRPGAEPVTTAVELDRVLRVVAALSAEGVIVSIDTSKPAVARAAVVAGAEVINDVNGARTPAMAEVMADTGAGVVVMHMQGEPRTMQENPSYEDVVGEVLGFVTEQAGFLTDRGVDEASIAIDPGIGFGKTMNHNLELLDGIAAFAETGYPVVLGTSRKRFLGTISGITTAADRDPATAVTTAVGFDRGARVFRVHDVGASRVALSVAAANVPDQQWDEWLQDSSPVVSPG